MKNKIHNVMIIGSGPAGLTAAIYCARANLNPIVFTGIQPGGQLLNTTIVENWPGEENGILGSNLMDKMFLQAKKFNTKILNTSIKKINIKKKPFILYSEDDDEYYCNSLIIATGSNPRLLNLKEEKKFMGKGLSTCATCDGPFYKNKDVLVIGGGNTAIEEVIYLSKIAQNITLIHRSNKLRAEKILVNKLFEISNNLNNIKFKWFCTVTNILGHEVVNAAKIYNNEKKKYEILKTDGMFIAIGNIPNTQLFINQLEIEPEGYIKIYNSYGNNKKTSIDGVYAAGDVMDKNYKQAITASASGCQAAINVEKYLSFL